MQKKYACEPLLSAESVSQDKMLAFVSQITAAYVGHNAMATSELPSLMNAVYNQLSRLGSGAAPAETPPEPAVSIRKSVTPEYLVCLEDGKKLKMLKRHIKTSYNMTPEQYRERWGLAADYPMVAPNYAKHRSKLAKQIGLGTAKKRTKKGA